jgi:hypothetical protein
MQEPPFWLMRRTALQFSCQIPTAPRKSGRTGLGATVELSAPLLGAGDGPSSRSYKERGIT